MTALEPFQSKTVIAVPDITIQNLRAARTLDMGGLPESLADAASRHPGRAVANLRGALTGQQV